MKRTLTNLLLKNIELSGIENEVFYTKHDEEYIPYRYKDLIDQIICLNDFFKKCGLTEGDKVGIVSESRTEWVAVDFACMFSKLILIPIYTSVSDSQIEYILENSGAKICFVSTSLLLDKVLKIKNDNSEKTKSLKELIIFNEKEE